MDCLLERTNLHHSVVLVHVRTNDQLAAFVHQGVVFLLTMEDTTPAVGDSNEMSTAKLFLNSLCERWSTHDNRRPRHSHDSLCTKRKYRPGTLLEKKEEESAQYSSRCLLACCALSKLRAVVAVRNQTCRKRARQDGTSRACSTK